MVMEVLPGGDFMGLLMKMVSMCNVGVTYSVYMLVYIC